MLTNGEPLAGTIRRASSAQIAEVQSFGNFKNQNLIQNEILNLIFPKNQIKLSSARYCEAGEAF